MQDDAVRYNNLASRFLEEGDLVQACLAAREAIRCDPTLWQPVHTLAVALERQRNFPAAISCYRHTLALNPQHPLARQQMIGALLREGLSGEALAECAALLARNPGDSGVWCNMGLALRQLGRSQEAIASYRSGLALAPADPSLHWNLSLALLTTGQFAEGWREYEWRVAAGIAPPTLRDEPLWRGEPLAGKSILLETEQGLGDTIQFLRYAPWFESQGARVFVDCQLRLRSLCKRWIASEAIDYDFRAPIMSLPFLCGGVLPPAAPYLSAPAMRLGDGFHVGLCWSGNAANSNDRFRSLPPQLLQPLLQIPGIHWVSLEQQPGDTVEQLASTLQGLDLVITVDTMIAHLAGALGRQVWTLLCFSPDWRWLEEGDSSYWYPTMRLFRQPAPGDWASVIHRVGRELYPAQSSDLRLSTTRPADLSVNACVR